MCFRNHNYKVIKTVETPKNEVGPTAFFLGLPTAQHRHSSFPQAEPKQCQEEEGPGDSGKAETYPNSATITKP